MDLTQTVRAWYRLADALNVPCAIERADGLLWGNSGLTSPLTKETTVPHNAPYTCRRDAFARGEYVRFSSHGTGDCAWCGQTRRTVFGYVWQSDDKRSPIERDVDYWFCNLECHDSFSN